VTTPFSSAYKTLKARLNAQLAHILVNGVDPDRADRWTPDSYSVQAKTIGDIVSGAQSVVGNLTTVDMSRKFGKRVTPVGPLIGMRDTGIPKAVEYQRPFREISKARLDGKDIPQAMQAGLARLNILTDTDLQMAKVRQAQISLRAVGAETYRRVTTSEDPCALCEIAATQIYYTDDLMPIHPRCSCDIVPDNYDGDQDEADKFFDGVTDTDHSQDVKELDQKDSPAVDFRKLIATRNHGEIGPVLTWREQHFLGPNDLPERGLTYGPARFGHNETPEESKQRQLEMMRKQLLKSIGKQGGRDFFKMSTVEDRNAAVTRAAKTYNEVFPAPKSKAAQAADDLSKKIGIPVDFDSHKEIDAIEGISRAAADLAEKYPHIPVKAITSTADMFHANAYAETGPFKRPAGETEIHFNPRMMSHAPGKMQDVYEGDVAMGFHPDLGNATGPQAVYTHEFGHSMDFLSGMRASRLAENALRTRFLEIHDPDRTKYSIMAQIRSGMNNNDINELSERVAALGKADFEDWLVDQLSGYSFEEHTEKFMNARRRGIRISAPRLNPTEALAEAFSHVELDPGNATDAERALHDLLVQTSRPQANILTREAEPLSPAKSISFAKDYGGHFTAQGADHEYTIVNRSGGWDLIIRDRSGFEISRHHEKRKADIVAVAARYERSSLAERLDMRQQFRPSTPHAMVMASEPARVGQAMQSEIDAKPFRDRISEAKAKQAKGRGPATVNKKTGKLPDFQLVRDQMDPRRIANNMVQLSREITEPIIEDAKVWYPDARVTVNDINRKYGNPISEQHAQAIAAAFSPQRVWQMNLVDTEAFIKSVAQGDSTAQRFAAVKEATSKGNVVLVDGKPMKVIGVTDDNLVRAEAVLHARNFNEIDLALRGVGSTNTPHYDNSQKIRNFVRNLLGDHTKRTIDTWMGYSARLSPRERVDLINANWAPKHKGQLKYHYGDRVHYKDVQLANRLANTVNEEAEARGEDPPFMPDSKLMVEHGYDMVNQALGYAADDFGRLEDDEFQAALWIVLRGTGT
jgi:hypothetical protein